MRFEYPLAIVMYRNIDSKYQNKTDGDKRNCIDKTTVVGY